MVGTEFPEAPVIMSGWQASVNRCRLHIYRCRLHIDRATTLAVDNRAADDSTNNTTNNCVTQLVRGIGRGYGREGCSDQCGTYDQSCLHIEFHFNLLE